MNIALSLMAGALLCASAFADDRVIYGDDDRRDLYASDVDPQMRKLARSTALLVRRTELQPDADASFSKLDTRPFSEAVGGPMCNDEPFRSQPTVGYCSGFLVGPDTFVTAGHCMRSVDCSSMAVVFGYGLDSETKDLTRVPNVDVYTCREQVVQVLEAGVGDDFAVIKLDRPVVGRQPLAVRRSGSVAVGDGLTVIGHPMALPTKIAGGRSAVRRVDDRPFFMASLDSYGGNSGSAVFNSRTYEVEGLLVRGEQDLEMEDNCLRSKRCSQDDCRGEDVTRIANVLEYIFPEGDEQHTTQPVFAEQAALDLGIPDNDPAGVTLDLVITAPGKIAKAGLKVRVDHSYVADLEVLLVHPDGTRVLLPRHGNAQGDVELGWGSDGSLTPSLNVLRGKEARGSWKLIVRDMTPSDEGMLKAARLKLDVYQD
jgi:subtilisin-like proprotein convertase family protein